MVLETSSGLLLVGLGVLVLLARPRHPPARAFGVFSMLWGADIILVNMAFLGLDAFERFLYAAAVVEVGAAASLVWLTRLFPAAGGPDDRAAFWVAGCIGGASAIIAFVWTAASLGRLEELEPVAYSDGLLVFVMAYPLFLGALLYAIVLWSLRPLWLPPADGRSRRQYALATAALVSWVGFLAGTGPSENVSFRIGIATQDSFILVLTGLPLVVLFLAAGLWLYGQHRMPDRRLGRNMAWFILALPLAGVMYTFMEPWGAFALTRVLATALLAIGILRFNLLSLDVKIRWTVSRSTVAAAFVIAFFLASEGAQVFFGDRLENEYLGIAAAALLLVALVPLQRVADGVAAKAVPGSGEGLFRPERIEGAYHEAVRLAMRDREITPEEEVRLAAVAERMGISAGRATEIRQSVGAERSKGQTSRSDNG